MKNLVLKFLMGFPILISLFSCNNNPPAPQFASDFDSRPSLRFMTYGSNLYAEGGDHLSLFDISDVNNPKLALNLVQSSQFINLCKDTFLIVSGLSGYSTYGGNTYAFTNVYSLENPAMPMSVLHNNQLYYNYNAFYAENNGTIYSVVKAEAKQLLLMSYIDPATKVYKTVSAVGDSVFSPLAISCSDKNLFIAENGKLKIYDFSGGNTAPVLNQSIKMNTGMLSYQNGILFVLAAGYLSQYSYSNNTLSLLSKIPVATNQ